MQAREHIARAEALLGREVGAGLRVDRLLYVGDLLAVYQAESPTRGKLVVKVLRSELARSIGGDLSPALRVAKDLSHPRAPCVSEEIAVSDSIGVVMSHVAGESLRDLLMRRGALPPTEALRIAMDCLDVIATAHSRGLTHGALSTSHLLIAESGNVNVLGFGEARLRRQVARPLPLAFTPPENQLSPDLESPLADLWSVAALAFAMLTAHDPYGSPLGVTASRTPETPVPLAHVTPRAPDELAHLFDRALSPDPSYRHEDAGALRAALHAVSQVPALLLAPALTSRLAPSSVAPPVLDAVRELRRTAPAPRSSSAPPPKTSGTRRTPIRSPHDAERSARSSQPASAAPAPHPSPVLGTPSAGPSASNGLPGRAGVSSRPPARAAVSARPPAQGAVSSRPPPQEASPAPSSHRPVAPSPRADTHPALELGDAGPSSVHRRQLADLSLGIATSDEAGTAALGELLSALNRAVQARQGAGHADPRLALDELIESAARTLSRVSGGLSCKVLPDSLATDVRVVWKAPGALEPAVSKLRAAGVAALAFVPGLGSDDLAPLVRLLAGAANADTTPGGLLLDLLDADFAHVIVHAPDLMAGMDASQRESLAAEERRARALLAFDSSLQLEDCWQAATVGKRPGTARFGDELSALSRELGGRSNESFLLDDEMLETGHARLIRLAATSLVGPAFEPALEAFGPILRRVLEERAEKDPDEALEALVGLLRSVRGPADTTQARQRSLVDALLAPALASTLFGRATHHNVAAQTLDRLAELLPSISGDHVTMLATLAPFVLDLQLQAKINHHLEFGVSGHEAALADLASRSPPDLAVGLVRLLGRIDTLAAQRALDTLADTPHLVVRLEALGLRDGPSGDRLRLELKYLLEEAPELERIAVLRAIIDADIRVAAPAVALRLRSAQLDSLPFEEKRLLLNAICLLAPHRAETIAADLLSKSRLLANAEHEETRALAASALGAVGSSQEALELLSDFARRRWSSSETVREAAERALEQRRQRMAQPRSSERPRGGPSERPAGHERHSALPSERASVRPASVQAPNGGSPRNRGGRS